MPTSIRYEIYNPNNPVHLECSGRLSDYKSIRDELERAANPDKDIPPMLPLTPEVLAAHPLGILVFETDTEGTPDTLRAYNAIRAEYTEDRAIEIGGLISNPEYDGSGWAYAAKPEIYRHIRERWFGWKVVIFANDLSSGMNRGMGFTDAEDVPDAAYQYCRDECETFKKGLEPGRKCCDQENIIDITASAESLGYAESVAVRKMTEKGLL